MKLACYKLAILRNISELWNINSELWEIKTQLCYKLWKSELRDINWQDVSERFDFLYDFLFFPLGWIVFAYPRRSCPPSEMSLCCRRVIFLRPDGIRLHEGPSRSDQVLTWFCFDCFTYAELIHQKIYFKRIQLCTKLEYQYEVSFFLNLSTNVSQMSVSAFLILYSNFSTAVCSTDWVYRTMT